VHATHEYLSTLSFVRVGARTYLSSTPSTWDSMGKKRQRQEFEEDINDPSVTAPQRNGSFSAVSTMADPIEAGADGSQSNKRDADALNDQGEWQVVGSSKKKKKKNKKGGTDDQTQSSNSRLRFNEQRDGAPVRIKDLQCLALYTLADGVAPTWVAVRDAKSIQQVLVLMVPGMDKSMLEDAAQKITDAAKEASIGNSANGLIEPVTPLDVLLQQNSKNEEQASSEPLSDYIIRVKAPGDSKTGRMHSPLQTMLISPEETKSNKGKRDAADIFHPVQTPLVQYIHTPEELVDAEYPVHPAIFTSSADAKLEHTRREAVGQSESGGWVDTLVTESAPRRRSENASHPVLEGYKVYALDCEMVLTTDDRYSLARISITDWDGKLIMDKLVVPDLPIKNYFTQYSGITEEKLKGVTARLKDIQKSLSELFDSSTILIGHSLESDFNALKMTHPFVVDTSMLYPHPRGLPLRSSLKFLSIKYLKREIQKGGADGHDSVEDARAVLDLVKLKCEKGPTYGTLDMNGESIFSRLERAGRKTAMVEYGTPERGFGRFATVKIGCQNDDEIVDGLKKATSKGDQGHAAAFTWARLRDMEAVRGWNKPGPAASTSEDAHTNGDGDVNSEAEHQVKVDTAALQTVDRLVEIYSTLEPSTLVIIFPGPGDMRELLRLQEMQRTYKREFKVKKWDELSVQWTDNEEQALRKAFNEARAGWALVCVK
jgi:RNA exonuclease 1